MNSRNRRRPSRPVTPRSLMEGLENRILMSGRTGHFNMGGGVPGVPDNYVSTIEWLGEPAKVRTGSWLIGFEDMQPDEVAKARALAVGTQLGVTVDSVQSLARGRYARIQVSGLVTELAVGKVRAAKMGVLNVEPDRIYEPHAVPNDPLFTSQWWLDNTGQTIGQTGVVGADIHAVDAWNTTIGSTSVIIGVIDSGVQIDHPDLADNIWKNPGELPGNGIDDDGNGFIDDVNGWDFGALDNDPDDDIVGHGTPCAGMIGAVGNNGVGLVGVAWEVSILPLKIADRYGFFSTAAIVGAHDYCTMMRGRGVDIAATNNSYGLIAGTFYDEQPTGFNAEKDAIQRYVDSGGTFVASAGNSSLDNDENFRAFPASYSITGIIAVAATDNTDALADFSNWGAQNVDLGAPGVNTASTSIGSGYEYFGGTSAAGPAVVGAVALLKSVKPNASAVEIREALINSCDPLPALQGRVVSGGRLNVARALEIIGVAGPVIRQVNPGPFTTQTDVNTGQVIQSVSITFSKDIDPAFLATAGVSLVRNGDDNIFGTGDDLPVGISSIARSVSDHKTVVIGLNVSGFPLQRLPLDGYRLTLVASTFRDTDGNYLNGTTAGGVNQAYDFTVVSVTGAFEPNDTIATATPVIFDASGTAVFNGAALGNGLFAGLDVDLYRIDIPRAGQFTADVSARRLPNPSSLDSVLRLFNANGVEITRNDQFFGADSYIDFFLNTAGTYYIGVSGFNNLNYNPNIGGSGSSQSTGEYTLTLGVQLVADDQVAVGGTLPAPKPIPTQGQVTDTLDVDDSRQILDLNVRLDISHPFVGDLVISLTSPSGKIVTLVNRRGGSGQNFTNTLLDDEGPTPLTGGFAPFTGTFRPDTPLSGFDGLSALGVWTLTVNDAAALNSGILTGWSLEFTLSNNIYGPFESNDTIRTATINTGLGVGVGTTTIDGFLGDGGFGTFDRDVFRIVVVAGTTLNATAVPRAATLNGPANLNTALRLFDIAGQEISFAAPTDTKDARIENFVFRDGGIFYLALSEGANLTYNPFIVTGGVAAASTGNYTLTISLNFGVSDSPMLLDGNALDVGISGAGTFLSPPGSIQGTNSTAAGLRWNGIEFLFDDSEAAPAPFSFFGASAAGATFVNYNTVQNGQPATLLQLPVALSAQNDAFNRRVVVTGSFGDLRVERAISFGVNDSFIAFDITLTNLGASPLSEVGWMEAFNPQQGLNLGPQTTLTRNDVDGRFGSASYQNNTFQQGLTVAMGAPAAEDRATVKFVPSTQTLRDPFQLLALPSIDPQGASSDDSLSIAFDFGTMDAAGGPESVVHARYFIFFGSTPGAAEALYDQLNNGTGTGHLTVDSAQPASEQLSNGQFVPTLPYRAYYPEGFANAQTYTFIPVLNPSESSNRIVIIARYETGERDQIISQFTLPASSRGGITITTPDMYRFDQLLVRKDTPYSIEIRSESPVAATFSHYDEFILAGSRAAVGESFTTRLGTDWTFGQVTKGGGIGEAAGTSDFILFTNVSDQTIKVEATFFPEDGGAAVKATRTVEPFRRGGWAINDLPELEAGKTYGVLVNAEAPIVAALSHYDTGTRSASGLSGVPGAGTLTGVIPEGQLGIGSTDEALGIVNPGASSATVTLSFLLSNGSTYRTVVAVPPRSQKIVEVAELPAFPTGQTYSVLYDSTAPVTITLRALEYGEGGATAFSDRAYTYWGFGEGFRNPVDGVVTERLKIFNPGDSDTLVEITIRFDNNLGTETFRATVPARQSVDLNIHDFVTGSRRDVLAFYGLTVKSATPIVASMDHYDAFFPGAFATIGTPLGLSEEIA